MPIQSGQVTYRDVKQNTTTGIQYLPFEKKFLIILIDDKKRSLGFETDAKGKFSYNVPVGNYIGVLIKQVDFAEATPKNYSGGRVLEIKSNSPANTLDKFLKAEAGTANDALIAQYQKLFDGMQAVLKQFQDQTESVGTGKFVKESGVTWACNSNGGVYVGGSVETNFDLISYNDFGLYAVTNPKAINPPDKYRGDQGFRFIIPINCYRNGPEVFQWGLPFRKEASLAWRTVLGNSSDGKWVYSRDTSNTIVDENGILYDSTVSNKQALVVGDYGVGSRTLQVISKEQIESYIDTGFYALTFDTKSNESPFRYGTMLAMCYRPQHITQNQIAISNTTPEIAFRATQVGRDWIHLLHKKNTVVDSNGNYKPASPVIQLHHNRVECNEDFDKDNPPKFEHLEIGVYRITNVREIAKDGWTFNKPLNGKGQPFFMLKYEQEDETTLIVRVFERTFNSETGEFGFGAPRNIGEHERWVDFHFEVDHERIAREEAEAQKEQEEWEEKERLRKEAEEKAEKEAQEAWEAEIAKQEAEMIAEMEAQEHQ